MKSIHKTIALLALTVILFAGCANPDLGEPISSATSTAATTEDAAPSSVEAEPLWAASPYDPWTQREQAEPLALGKLYYTLDPQLPEGTAADKSSRYVMSFTYVTADYHRYPMRDYLESKGFEQITRPFDEQGKILLSFVCVTEEELQTITPESVQEFYQLETVPAVVGIHRYDIPDRAAAYVYNSEANWYRADLMWGEERLADDYPYSDGAVTLYESLHPDRISDSNLDPKKRYAIYVEVFGEGVSTADEGSADKFFAGKGWEALSLAECSNHSKVISETPASTALIAVTLEQLWTVTIEELAQYYGCEPMQIGVSFFQAQPPIEEPNP